MLTWSHFSWISKKIYSLILKIKSILNFGCSFSNIFQWRWRKVFCFCRSDTWLLSDITGLRRRYLVSGYSSALEKLHLYQKRYISCKTTMVEIHRFGIQKENWFKTKYHQNRVVIEKDTLWRIFHRYIY